MAPEVLNGSYTAKADLWSVGTIFYQMLCGSPPFRASTHRELYEKIMRTPLSVPDRIKISAPCRDLLFRLLQRDPSKRIDYDEFFKHPFVFEEKLDSPEMDHVLIQEFEGLSLKENGSSRRSSSASGFEGERRGSIERIDKKIALHHRPNTEALELFKSREIRIKVARSISESEVFSRFERSYGLMHPKSLGMKLSCHLFFMKEQLGLINLIREWKTRVTRTRSSAAILDETDSILRRTLKSFAESISIGHSLSDNVCNLCRVGHIPLDSIELVLIEDLLYQIIEEKHMKLMEDVYLGRSDDVLLGACELYFLTQFLVESGTLDDSESMTECNSFT
jgi:serine/threonine protein kinase